MLVDKTVLGSCGCLSTRLPPSISWAWEILTDLEASLRGPEPAVLARPDHIRVAGGAGVERIPDVLQKAPDLGQVVLRVVLHAGAVAPELPRGRDVEGRVAAVTTAAVLVQPHWTRTGTQGGREQGPGGRL